LLRLPNGLLVHVRCELQARDGHRTLFAVGKPAQEALSVRVGVDLALPPTAAPEESAAPHAVESTEPASLRDADVDLIARTLKECGGNVSAAARKLRVSRGLIYRRTQGA
jgi:ActR/RegA family two-component response regulator